MPKYEVQVRLFDIDEPNPTSASRNVDEKLGAAGFGRRRIVAVRPMGARPTPRLRPRRRQRFALPRRSDPNIGGILLVAAAIAWWLSLLWAIE